MNRNVHAGNGDQKVIIFCHCCVTVKCHHWVTVVSPLGYRWVTVYYEHCKPVNQGSTLNEAIFGQEKKNVVEDVLCVVYSLKEVT